MDDEIVTSDLSKFGFRERAQVIKILSAWENFGLPEGFICDEITINFNRNSGFVFLSNSDYQVALMNGEQLDLWNTCHYCGYVGFPDDCELNIDGCECCHPTDIDEATT